MCARSILFVVFLVIFSFIGLGAARVAGFLFPRKIPTTLGGLAHRAAALRTATPGDCGPRRVGGTRRRTTRTRQNPTQDNQGHRFHLPSYTCTTVIDENASKKV